MVDPYILEKSSHMPKCPDRRGMHGDLKKLFGASQKEGQKHSWMATIASYISGSRDIEMDT